MFRKVLTYTVFALGLTGLGATAGQTAELNDYVVVNGKKIPEYLSGKPGDPERGRKLAMTRSKGNCLACHKMPIDAPDHGEIGPSLHGVADRMSEGQMRLRLVDPKKIVPGSMMPAYYKVEGLHRVRKKFRGKPLLKAQEIEDIIAYLKTLKEGES